jgi:hypothetical protein
LFDLRFDWEAIMIEKIWSWRVRGLPGDSPNVSHSKVEGTIAASQLREIAAEAGLVASVDSSLAGLVNLWANDARLHPSAPQRARWHRTN